jgi:Ser/Thr protein kinase RdoA (MazF antagonist)
MLRVDDAPAIAAAFDLGGDPRLEGPTGRGRLGRVWRLTTDAGRFAVKEWFAGHDIAALTTQAAFSERVRRAGVCTPEVVTTRGGEVVARVDGGLVRVFEWLDLRPPTRALPPDAVGRLLAGLHCAATPTDEPVDRWFSAGVGERSWRTILERVRAEQAPFTRQLDDLVDDLVAVEAVIEPHESPVTCHRDLWADNVLATEDGQVCVIDFENMGPADPSQELAMVLFEFGDDDPSRARLLHEAYVAAGGPGRVTRRGHFSMLVAEQAHIGQFACSKWVGTEDPGERERLAAWVLEIPEDPVTPARIDRILAAVA